MAKTNKKNEKILTEDAFNANGNAHIESEILTENVNEEINESNEESDNTVTKAIVNKLSKNNGFSDEDDYE